MTTTTTTGAQRNGVRANATRRVTSAKIVLRPIGDNDPDHLIRSGLAPAPEAIAIEFTSAVSVVGRDDDADVIIPIPTVSGAHAKVEVDGESFFVTDLESTNGTYVNSERIKSGEKTQVTVGSNVIFGDANLASYVVQREAEA